MLATPSPLTYQDILQSFSSPRMSLQWMLENTPPLLYHCSLQCYSAPRVALRWMLESPHPLIYHHTLQCSGSPRVVLQWMLGNPPLLIYHILQCSSSPRKTLRWMLGNPPPLIYHRTLSCSSSATVALWWMVDAGKSAPAQFTIYSAPAVLERFCSGCWKICTCSFTGLFCSGPPLSEWLCGGFISICPSFTVALRPLRWILENVPSLFYNPTLQCSSSPRVALRWMVKNPPLFIHHYILT